LRLPAAPAGTEATEPPSGAPVPRTLPSGDRIFETTWRELGLDVDVAATRERVAAVGHRGPPWRRLRETWNARRGRIDVPLVWSLDETKAREVLSSYAPASRCDAVDARLDLDGHQRVPEVAGQTLDVEASLRALASAAHTDDEIIELVTSSLPARVTMADLSRVDVTKLLSGYETTYLT